MNIQEYISSGIIESCVLGLAPEEDRIAFDKMCEEHEEVRNARDLFEKNLEESALSNAVPPPAALRQPILDALAKEGKPSGRRLKIAEPKTQAKAAPVVAVGSKRTTYLAAASVTLLLVSVAMNYYYFRQYKTYSDRYDALVILNSQLAKDNSARQARLDEYSLAMEHLKDPGMAIIKMAATGVKTSPDPSLTATIYWDTKTKDVFLLINNMPSLSTGKQYQLWAIVNGQPVDAGVFDMSAGLPVVKMKNIPKAEAFAITLEKTGGSPNPDMNQLYVIGKV